MLSEASLGIELQVAGTVAIVDSTILGGKNGTKGFEDFLRAGVWFRQLGHRGFPIDGIGQQCTEVSTQEVHRERWVKSLIPMGRKTVLNHCTVSGRTFKDTRYQEMFLRVRYAFFSPPVLAD